jgi:purine-binding chemotaxis protein CheW
MVDLVKLRKKAKKQAPEVPAVVSSLSEAEGTASPEPQAEHHAEQQTSDNLLKTSDNLHGSDKLQRFKEEAGHRREGLVVETQETTAADVAELLTFVIAGENYAVAIENIVEIVTPRPVTRIPNADDTIVGIISLRGTIVTLLDVRRKLRHPPATAAGADTRIVVLEHRGETVGFEVDRVLRVVKTAAGAIEPHPVVHSSELDDAIRGVFRQANALTILLDLDKLLDSRGHAATQEAIAARR